MSLETYLWYEKSILGWFGQPGQYHKKKPSQVAHNQPQTFFHSTGPAAQTSPELIFHIINMSQDSSVYWSVINICC